MKFRILITTLALMVGLGGVAMADGAVPATGTEVPTLDPAPASQAPTQAAPTDAARTPRADAESFDLGAVLPEIVFVQGPLPCGLGGCSGPGGGGGGTGGGNGYTCSVTITCPGGTVGSHTIDPYPLTCQGRNSCSAYPNASNPYAVVCDGIGTCCFPDSNGC
ncbi:MAG: hypothetical protein AAFY88_14740 [Acidobacteriota bacterium]